MVEPQFHKGKHARKNRGGAGWVFGLVLVILLLPVLYFLSIGPVTWLMGKESSWWTEAFYYPLGWLAKSSKPFHDALTWYLGLWKSG